MKGRHDVTRQPQRGGGPLGLDPRPEGHQRIDHDVAHELDPILGNTFSAQVLNRVG